MLFAKRQFFRFLLACHFLFFLNASSAQDGLFLSLKLMDDNCWGVFVQPIGVTPDSTTITGSGQVTLIFPIDVSWCCLTSHSGLWMNNANVIGPSEAPNSQIISFGLVSAEPVHPIYYTAGVETLLFSFCIYDDQGNDDCPESIELINCGVAGQTPHPFCPTNSVNSNPGNDLSVIQFGGGIAFYNFEGIYGPNAWNCNDCDGDGIEDAFEDTNGNGIFDPGVDSSDLCDPCDPLYPNLIGYLELLGDAQAVCADDMDSVFLQVALTDMSGQPMPDGYGPIRVLINDSDSAFFSSDNYFVGDSIVVPYRPDTTVYQLASVILGQYCEADLDSSQIDIKIPTDGPLLFIAQPADIVECQGDGYYFYASATNTYGNQLNYNWQCSQNGNSWIDLENIFPYEGVYSDTLFISDFNGLTGNYYRLAVHSIYCDTVFSEDALLEYDGWLLEKFDTINICAGDSIWIFGNYENEAGEYSGIVPGNIGCDTVLNILLEINDLEEKHETINICAGDSVLIFGNYENEAGNYSSIISGNTGCDTIFNVELIVSDLEEKLEVINICSGDSVFIFGNYENEVGEYSGIVPGTVGCDTILTVDLAINNLEEKYETINICSGDSALIFGNYENEAGEYSGIIPGAVGCDTVLNVLLEVNDLEEKYEIVNICSGDSALVFGNYENEAGEYSGIISGSIGCDTVLNVLLEVNDLEEKYEIVNICSGDSALVFGNYENEAGEYSGIIPNMVGCDTVLTISLEIEPPIFLFENINICEGDSALVLGNYETVAGNYEGVLPGINGCDTAVLIALSVTPFEVASETIMICEGDSALIFGSYETVPGEYSGIVNSGGCDILMSYFLEISPPVDFDILIEDSCPNAATGALETFVINGASPFNYQWSNNENNPIINDLNAGEYFLTVTDANGCTHSQNAIVGTLLPIVFDYEIKDVSCDGIADGEIAILNFPIGTMFSLDGQPFTNEPIFMDLSAGEYNLQLQSQEGCIYSGPFIIQQAESFDLYLPDDLTIYLGDSIQLTSQVSSFDSMFYEWTPTDFLNCPNCPNPWASPLETINYTLIATDENGCSETAEIAVFVNKNERVYVPNAFSPNGDGINDQLIIYGDHSLRQVKQFLVFDRWGEMVFRQDGFPANDPAYGWDGSFKGIPLNASVYMWMAVVGYVDGREELLKGNVHLIR